MPGALFVKQPGLKLRLGYPFLCDGKVAGVYLNPDESPAGADAGDAGRTAAREGIKDNAAWFYPLVYDVFNLS